MLCIFICLSTNAQLDTTKTKVKQIDKYGFEFLQNKGNNVYGFCFGLIGSEVLCYVKYTRYSYGINFQLIGHGIFQTFAITASYFKRAKAIFDKRGSLKPFDSIPLRTVHNGLVISCFGTYTSVTNGINISPWMATSHEINGLSCNLLWNFAVKVNGVSIGIFNSSLFMKGLQIGLINKAILLKGIQIGLWNKNEKRSLPFINWNFSRRLPVKS